MSEATDRFVSAALAPKPAPSRPWLEKTAFALAVAYVVFLVSAFCGGVWLEDKSGRAIQTDFINVWAAGRLVLDGKAPQAYDWPIHKAVEEQGVGHPFEKYFSWPYPPPYLLIAVVLSLLPYLAALLLWMALTFPLYAFTITRIVGQRIGFVLAGAFPGVLWNVWTGQNGFLTAALLGSAVEAMERRPRLAGVFLGLLSYKPQFGVLFPIVLIAGGQWSVFAYAVATAAAMIVVSWLAFGIVTWQAFFEYFPLTGEAILGRGLVGYHKLQTIFGMVRACGGGETLAWALQAGLAVAVGVAVLLLWRRRIAFEIKAAALCTASLMATPYLYVYDLVVLAVPMAFLIRLGWREGLSWWETAVLALAALLVFTAPLFGFPTGFPAVLLVWLVICRRGLDGPRDAGLAVA